MVASCDSVVRKYLDTSNGLCVPVAVVKNFSTVGSMLDAAKWFMDISDLTSYGVRTVVEAAPVAVVEETRVEHAGGFLSDVLQEEHLSDVLECFGEEPKLSEFARVPLDWYKDGAVGTVLEKKDGLLQVTTEVGDHTVTLVDLVIHTRAALRVAASDSVTLETFGLRLRGRQGGGEAVVCSSGCLLLAEKGEEDELDPLMGKCYGLALEPGSTSMDVWPTFRALLDLPYASLASGMVLSTLRARLVGGDQWHVFGSDEVSVEQSVDKGFPLLTVLLCLVDGLESVLPGSLAQAVLDSVGWTTLDRVVEDRGGTCGSWCHGTADCRFVGCLCVEGMQLRRLGLCLDSFVGGESQLELWLSDMCGQKVSGLTDEMVLLATSTRAGLDVDQRKAQGVLESLGDALMTVYVAEHCRVVGGSRETVQTMRSDLTGTVNLCRVFGEHVPKGLLRVPAGVDPVKTKVGANAIEIFIAVVYVAAGFSGVAHFLRMIGFPGHSSGHFGVVPIATVVVPPGG